jgi:hypothetical protein
MREYGMELAEGAVIKNLTVPSGTTWPLAG